MKTNLVVACLAVALAGCGQHAPEPTSTAKPASAKTAGSPVTQVEQTPPSIKDVNLGDSMASVKAKHPNAQCMEDGKTPGCLVNGITYATVDGMMMIFFEHDRAVVVGVSHIDPSKFGTVTSALLAKFGKTDDALARLVGEPAGSLVWGGPSWVMVAEHSVGRGEATVILTDRDYMLKSMAAQKKQAEADL